jgi:hypothetical protein
MEVSGQLHASDALPRREILCNPLNRRLGGPPSRSGRGGEEKNSRPLPGSDKIVSEERPVTGFL